MDDFHTTNKKKIMLTEKEKNDGDCSVYEYGSLVARQPVRSKRENSTKKETDKFLLRYFTKVARISTLLQVKVDSKKSTLLQVESK